LAPEDVQPIGLDTAEPLESFEGGEQVCYTERDVVRDISRPILVGCGLGSMLEWDDCEEAINEQQ
jgi:hypothetical protein